MGRLTAAVLAAASGALLASSVAFAGSPTFPPTSVRLVTINVLQGVDSTFDENLPFDDEDALGSFLTVNDLDGAGPNRGLNPDIIALQECRSNVNLFSFRDTYLPGYQLFRIPDSDFGGNFNAFFVRPDITVLDSDTFTGGGPRRVIRLNVRVPGALRALSVYCSHMDSGGSSNDQNNRISESSTIASQVLLEATQGLDTTDTGTIDPMTTDVPAADARIVVMGDLNSNNNFDGTITNLVTSPFLIGIDEVDYESIAGAADPGLFTSTFQSGSRLDYILLDERFRDTYDTNGNGILEQDETNAAGFVYFSQHDNGQQANGVFDATTRASDHRAVVVDLLMETDPDQFFAPEDINQDDLVDAEDLQSWLTDLANGGTPDDVNEDFVLDASDAQQIEDAARADEGMDATSGTCSR